MFGDPFPFYLKHQVEQREERLRQCADEIRPLTGSHCSDDWTDDKLKNSKKLQRSLTRSLPVKDDNFDLRQHIITAGHQIDQCPHIQITSTSCTGYLQKMGSKFKTWKKRWFVFDHQSRTFVYHRSQHNQRVRGGVHFQAIEEVDGERSVKSHNSNVTFRIKTLGKTFYLMAPTAEAMRIWVDVIFTGAEGYREFQPDV
ncbi:hypothetical protein CHUAL_001716 [Chamberlinius hualienensis]